MTPVSTVITVTMSSTRTPQRRHVVLMTSQRNENREGTPFGHRKKSGVRTKIRLNRNLYTNRRSRQNHHSDLLV